MLSRTNRIGTAEVAVLLKSESSVKPVRDSTSRASNKKKRLARLRLPFRLTLMGRKRFRIKCSPDKWETSLPEQHYKKKRRRIEKTSEFRLTINLR
jgi:hypothetical protein